jgi:hypothetical protein
VNSTSRLFALALRVLVGVVLGVALVEGGLRLYFAEYEADRVYWGRDAFIAQDRFPYRHPANAELAVGREGSFAHVVQTNALGFRDEREPPTAPGEHRLLVAGASFAFGLGVIDPANMFHARLERGLRARRDWPDDLTVHNISQSGYNVASVIALLRAYRENYSPVAILMMIPPSAFKKQNAASSEIVNGYRMDPDRFGANTPLDWLRSRSFLYMRSSNPFEGGSAFHLARVSRVAGEPAELETTQRLIDALAAYRDELADEGIPLFCIPVGGATSAADPLRQIGFRVLKLPYSERWAIQGDFHMNDIGHRESADSVARSLPSFQRLVRLSR